MWLDRHQGTNKINIETANRRKTAKRNVDFRGRRPLVDGMHRERIM